MATPVETELEELKIRLQEVKTAISDVLAGAQEYSIGGQRFRRADLSQLRQLETTIRGQIGELTYSTRAFVTWNRR